MLRTPRTSAVLRTARDVETILVGRLGEAPMDRIALAEEAGATVLLSPTLEDSLIALRERGIRSLFVEGGGRVAGAFLREGLVDRLVIFRAPVELGSDAPKAFAHAPDGFEASLSEGRYRVVDHRRFGDDTMTVYALREVPCSPG
jgi:diaminohydroxyphosphoribosylaminopyrimidine deaminase/5-amino-6-(5-phosphoribosylamino)uracil reductase